MLNISTNFYKRTSSTYPSLCFCSNYDSQQWSALLGRTSLPQPIATHLGEKSSKRCYSGGVQHRSYVMKIITPELEYDASHYRASLNNGTPQLAVYRTVCTKSFKKQFCTFCLRRTSDSCNIVLCSIMFTYYSFNECNIWTDFWYL